MAPTTCAIPFEAEPGWGVSSVNYDLKALLERAKNSTLDELSRQISAQAHRGRAAARCDQRERASKEKVHPGMAIHRLSIYWWARRPLAAARAVIFAQLVNDPGYQQGGGFKYGKNKKEAAIERKRLFKIIEDLVLWENTTNEDVLEAPAQRFAAHGAKCAN